MGDARGPRLRPWKIAPALAWQALIWLLSSRPWPGAGGWIARLWLALPRWLSAHLPADKAVHALFFGVLAGLWHLGLPPRRGRAALAWGLAVLWGVIDELHQSQVPGRSADPWDALADACGALIAVVALAALGRGRAPSPPTGPLRRGG